MPIVDSVELELRPGELALLTGMNGAGKSTLLRAIVGLLPSRGDLSIYGRHANSHEARDVFVYVPDEPALYEDLTLREHARFNSLVYADPGADERATSWLEEFGLGDKVDEFPGTHSRGMRQKLSLSLALALERPLILLDEPFNGLDAAAQDLLAGALAGAAKNGAAVLLTGHQLDLGDRLEPRTLTLADGRLSG